MIISVHDNFGQKQVLRIEKAKNCRHRLKTRRLLKFFVGMPLFLPADVHQRIAEGLPVTGPCSDVQVWNERQNRFVCVRRWCC